MLRIRPKSRVLPRARPTRNASYSSTNRFSLSIHPEIEDALHSGKPIVALESALITHGMPQPVNLETARSSERIVRSTGAIPATIAILNGRAHVGLTSSELEYLADVSAHPNAVKVSRRDIAPAIALNMTGGTTISGTMILAARAGIKVFATGGLGGVHRGGENSLDISADLTELGRTPLAVFAGGAKSILDIGRTLEYLETQGVTVATYGETNDFPAFYSPNSGFKSPWRVTTPEEAAKLISTAHALELGSGQFFGVPIPAEFAEAGLLIQAAVDQAVAESEENGMSRRGKEVTPWLLKRVGQLTSGKALENNVALIEHTSLIGGRVAVELAKMELSQTMPAQVLLANPNTTASTKPQPPRQEPKPLAKAELLVLGAAAIDITSCANSSSSLATHSTSPGTVSLALGGVARNMAEAAHRSAASTNTTLLISPLGNDAFSGLLKAESAKLNMRSDGFLYPDSGVGSESNKTPVCNLVLDERGGLIGGVADFKILENVDEMEIIAHIDKHAPKLVALDANFSAHVLSAVLAHCWKHRIHTWYEPTSLPKSLHIIPGLSAVHEHHSETSPRCPLTYASPNVLELGHLFDNARQSELFSDQWWKTLDSFGISESSGYQASLARLAKLPITFDGKKEELGELLIGKGITRMAINLLPFFQHLIIKCGDKGVVLVMNLHSEAAREWETDIQRRQVIHRTESGGAIVIKHFPPLQIPASEIISTTGAGDSLVGCLLSKVVSSNHLIWSKPEMLDRGMNQAQTAALLSLQSSLAVSPLVRPSSDIPQ